MAPGLWTPLPKYPGAGATSGSRSRPVLSYLKGLPSGYVPAALGAETVALTTGAGAGDLTATGASDVGATTGAGAVVDSTGAGASVVATTTGAMVCTDAGATN